MTAPGSFMFMKSTLINVSNTLNSASIIASPAIWQSVGVRMFIIQPPAVKNVYMIWVYIYIIVDEYLLASINSYTASHDN